MRRARSARRAFAAMTDPLIEREEIVALLCDVADVAAPADGIESVLRGEEDDGEEETDEG
jgi:hypothetical protein